jgi:predicted dehydrogenase
VTLEVTESWAMHLDRVEGSFVLGDQGGVKLAPFAHFHRVGELDLGGTADLGDARFRWNTVHGDGDWYGDCHRHWLGALTGKVPLLPTAALALNAALISEGIYRSAELGREVTAAEVIEGSRSAALPLG